MKSAFFKVLTVAGLMTALVSCGNKDSEKKISALEARLAELEGKNGTTTPATTDAPVVAPEEKPDGPLPIIEYASMDYDFGNITEGQIVEHTFTFKNTGEAPLIIQEAKPSCGCTVPEWSKEPIAVGASGFIKAVFDTNGKTNVQNKTITVTANTWPKQSTIRFTAMVAPKAN